MTINLGLLFFAALFVSSSALTLPVPAFALPPASFSSAHPPIYYHHSQSSSRLRMNNHPNTDKVSTSTSSTAASQLKQAKALISTAISIGAPAYNSGNIAECARIYQAIALELLSSDSVLPPSLLEGLRREAETDHADDTDAAWAFRNVFDAINEYIAPLTPSSTSMYRTDATTFEPFPTTTWQPPMTVNDNVMGGISRAQFTQSQSTTSAFSGMTSLANNGGFASLRWRFPTPQNWSYAKGIYLKGVRHSHPAQHTFRFILKDVACSSVGGRGANFKQVFCDPEQKKDAGSDDGNGDDSNPIIFIPFEMFDTMEAFGKKLNGGPGFNRGAVTELGWMAIKPSVVGEFELSIAEWGLYI